MFTRVTPYMALAGHLKSLNHGTNDRYNINPPGTDGFKVKNISKTHWCIVNQNLLPQVKNPSQVKIYSSWNPLIRLAFYGLYGKHYFASRTKTFNVKEAIFLLLI